MEVLGLVIFTGVVWVGSGKVLLWAANRRRLPGWLRTVLPLIAYLGGLLALPLVLLLPVLFVSAPAREGAKPAKLAQLPTKYDLR